MAGQLSAKLEAGKSLEDGVAEVVRATVHESKAIIFGGDNYSDEWHQEAERSGLLNLKTTLDALETLISDKNIKLFESYGVLSEAELRSREEIWVEQYFLKINIEAETTEAMAITMVMPAASRYLATLLKTIKSGKKVGVSTKGVKEVADHMAAYIDELQRALGKLIDANKDLGGESVHEKAHHMLHNVIPAMNKVRHATDRLERITAGDLWPLPTYRDILFVK